MRGVLLCFLVGVFVLGEGVTGGMGDPPIQKQTENPVKPANPVKPVNPTSPVKLANPVTPTNPVNPAGNTAVVQEVQKFVASATGEGLDEFNMVASQGQASAGSTPLSVQDSLFHMVLALVQLLCETGLLHYI